VYVNVRCFPVEFVVVVDVLHFVLQCMFNCKDFFKILFQLRLAPATTTSPWRSVLDDCLIARTLFKSSYSISEEAPRFDGGAGAVDDFVCGRRQDEKGSKWRCPKSMYQERDVTSTSAIL
jgi:hypothetical protein